MKNRRTFFLGAAIYLAVISCSTTMHPGPSPKATKTGTSTFLDLLVNSGPNDTVESLPTLGPESLQAWKGQWFSLLEKGAVYCNYGYELYSCPKLDSCREICDTAKWTKSHRARCSVFLRHRLKVLWVEPRGKEWLLVFGDEQTGDTLYAKTSGGTYHEIVRESDLAGAQKRWKGRVIFSARGFINTIEGGKSGTIKVDLRDPLLVSDVGFGVTPFPVKPIRLMVVTPYGWKGFIPVYYSWTNVKKEVMHKGNPWDEDIAEKNPAVLFPANEELWNIINNHTLQVGMTRDQVRLSWGLPQNRSTSTFKGKKCDCWKYSGQNLYFDGNKLIGSSTGAKRR